MTLTVLRQEGLEFSNIEEVEDSWKMSFAGSGNILLEWQGEDDEDKSSDRNGVVAGILQVPKADGESMAVEIIHLP